MIVVLSVILSIFRLFHEKIEKNLKSLTFSMSWTIILNQQTFVLIHFLLKHIFNSDIFTKSLFFLHGYLLFICFQNFLISLSRKQNSFTKTTVYFFQNLKNNNNAAVSIIAGYLSLTYAVPIYFTCLNIFI